MYLNKELKISSCVLYFSLELLYRLGDRLGAGANIGDPVHGNEHGSLYSRRSSHKMSLCFVAACKHCTHTHTQNENFVLVLE